MVKRTACSLLWLFAIAWAFNFISAYTGVPQGVGSVIAVAVAAFVGVDPLHAIWPRSVGPTKVREVASLTSGVPSHI